MPWLEEGSGDRRAAYLSLHPGVTSGSPSKSAAEGVRGAILAPFLVASPEFAARLTDVPVEFVLQHFSGVAFPAGLRAWAAGRAVGRPLGS